RRDAGPVGLRRVTRACVTGGDRGLERVGPERAAQPLGTLQRRETAPDEESVPARAVLIGPEDGLSRRADSGVQARALDPPQRHEAVDLRLERRELGEDA